MKYIENLIIRKIKELEKLKKKTQIKSNKPRKKLNNSDNLPYEEF